MKFSVDDTISMIPRKNIVGTTVYLLLTTAVKWSSGEVLMATVLAAGKCVQVVILCVYVCTCTDATIHVHVHVIQVIYHQCGRKKRRLCANI